MSSKGKKERKKGADGGQNANVALPAHLELQRTHLECGFENNTNVNTVTSANVYMSMGYDNSWDLGSFKNDFKMEVTDLNEERLEFELVGVDPSIANALRRILIADVPTIAIEHVFMVDNTSIIQDEVLSHRLGLVPLKIDPRLFEFKVAEDAPSEQNTVVFKLNVACKRVAGKVVNDVVRSSDLEWLPLGSEMPDETCCRFAAGQKHMFTDPASHPRPVHDDILLAKLRPGQRIELEAHCIKGYGKEHAKWSPVATAWYRLYPEVVLLKDITDGEMIDELLELAPGLFEARGDGKARTLKVNNARHFEKHLEKVRRLLEQERYAEVLSLRKRKDHFIFTVESTGVLPPEELFVQAVAILEEKAAKLLSRVG